MPHIRLECSANVAQEDQLAPLFASLVDILAGFDTITPSAIKAYGAVRYAWAMGEGARPGFIHCEIALLTGRNAALRTEIGAAIADYLERHFASEIASGKAGVTVEVREMDALTYQKRPAG